MNQEAILRGIVRLVNAGMATFIIAQAAGLVHSVVLGALVDEPLTTGQCHKLARTLRRHGAL